MIATLMALINPDDEIIIFEPYYENYGPDSILSGACPRYVTLHAPDWTYDYDELTAAFNEKTKAIIINTPNNPTGKVFSRKELEQIAELCQTNGCYAITDEIYEHILYDGVEHVSLATLPGMEDRTITINGLTKTYSVTGWRVGWAIASAKITQRIRKVHDFLTVSAPTPFQHAGLTALAMPDSYYEELASSYHKSREFLFDTLLEVGFKPFLPKGAYYIMVEVDDLRERLDVTDDFSFSKKLLERTSVATVPGTSFYADGVKGKNQMRFTFCKKMETLKLVRERLLELL